MPRGKRRSDRMLDPSYLGGLDALDEGRLRAMREECEEEENVVSYERSLIHSRLSILNAEIGRRANGGPARSLVDRLPEILSSGKPATHRGAFPKLDPPAMYETPRRRVEKLVNDDTLARLPELSDAEVHAIVVTLEETEREVSEARRAIQAVLDRLTEELGRRLAPHT
ncbi:MAG: aerial mycelium formation protein [Actinomycetota bacterium]